MSTFNYSKAKVFLGLLFSPMIGAFLVGMLAIIGAGGDVTFLKALIILLFTTLVGWVLFAIPALVLAIIAVWLKRFKNNGGRVQVTVLGAVLAGGWALLFLLADLDIEVLIFSIIVNMALAAISAFLVSHWVLPSADIHQPSSFNGRQPPLFS